MKSKSYTVQKVKEKKDGCRQLSTAQVIGDEAV